MKLKRTSIKATALITLLAFILTNSTSYSAPAVSLSSASPSLARELSLVNELSPAGIRSELRKAGLLPDVASRSEARVMELNQEQAQLLEEVVKHYHLSEADRIYLKGMWLQYLARMAGVQDPNKKALRIATDLKNIKDDENFILGSHLSVKEREELLGAFGYETLVSDKHKNAAKNVVLTANSMDGGIGESLARLLWLKKRAIEMAGSSDEVTLGAKGTDLGYDIEINGKKAFISIAQAKMIQLIQNAEQKKYSHIKFQPLVNHQSIKSYEDLFASPYFFDQLNGVVNPRTYRQAMEEAGIEILEMPQQADLPRISLEDNNITLKDKIKRQPGGHGQWGVFFMMAVLAKKLVQDGKTHIRAFYNGDNLNSAANENILGWMVENRIPIVKLTTAATPIDKKGGKDGVRIAEKNGKKVYVPDQMEVADAKSAKQEEFFYDAGQEGGNGEVGKQPFNTNVIYINESVLSPILNDLKEALGEDQFAAVISPTLIFQESKIVEIDGEKFIPVDGAIGNVVHNLNSFFMINKNEPAIKTIIERHHLSPDGRLLYFIDIPRTEFFTPVKVATDLWLQAYSDYYKFNIKTMRLEDSKKGLTPPEFNLTSKGADGKNDKYWTEVQNLADFLGRASTVELKSLTIDGKVSISDAKLKGDVTIINKSGKVVDFTNKDFKKQHSYLFRNGKLVLQNISITIKEDGTVESEEIVKDRWNRSEVRANDAWPTRKGEKIVVVGTGFVGTTEAIMDAVDWGHDVVGIDIDPDKVEKLNSGELPSYMPGVQELLQEGLASGRLRFVLNDKKADSDLNHLREAIDGRDLIFLAIDTPQSETGEANVNRLATAVRDIVRVMKPGETKILITKSTAPTSTEPLLWEAVQEEIAKRNLDNPPVIHFARVPEFLREGKEVEDARGGSGRIVIGADERDVRQRIANLYDYKYHNPKYARKDVPVVLTDLRSAPEVKYAGNGMRGTKISFINFIGWLTKTLGFDINDIADAIGQDDRIRRAFLSAGIGFGGSCFPKDFAAFVQVARSAGVPEDLLLDVLAVNEFQWQHFLSEINHAFETGVSGNKIVVLGGAFKPDTSDIREARSILLIKGLLKNGAEIHLFDPVATRELEKEAFPKDRKILYYDHEAQFDEMMEGADAIVLVTEWSIFKKFDVKYFEKLKAKFESEGRPLPHIFDGRNFWNRQQVAELTERLKFPYTGIGRSFSEEPTQQFVKYVTRFFLALRVAFINLLAEVADKTGANIRDIQKGLGLDPVVGLEHLSPGFGFGGVKLTRALEEIERLTRERSASYVNEFRAIRAKIKRKFGITENSDNDSNRIPFVTAINELNDRQIQLYLRKAEEAADGDLNGKKVAVLGLAFKPGTHSIENASSLKVIEALRAKGAIVLATDEDPQTIINTERELPSDSHLYYFQDVKSAVTASDVQILVTEWPAYANLKKILFSKRKPLPSHLKLVDGRHFYNPDEVRALEIEYYSVGIPNQKVSDRSEVRNMTEGTVWKNIGFSERAIKRTFGTNGIRADDLSVGGMRRIAKGSAQVLAEQWEKTHQGEELPWIAVGFDPRPQGGKGFKAGEASYAKAIAEVFAAYGFKVLFVSRPVAAPYMISATGTNVHPKNIFASIMVTASHNEVVDPQSGRLISGIKIFTGNAPAGEDITNPISDKINNPDFAKRAPQLRFQEAVNKGRITVVREFSDNDDLERVEFNRLYQTFNLRELGRKFTSEFPNLKIALNTEHGGMSKPGVEIYQSMGIPFRAFNTKFMNDRTIRNKIMGLVEYRDQEGNLKKTRFAPDPTREWMRGKEYLDYVASDPSHIISTLIDGDADRLVLEQFGKEIIPNEIGMLAIYYLVKYKGQTGRIVRTTPTTEGIDVIAQALGLGKVSVTPVGSKWFKGPNRYYDQTLNDVLVAVEESGHIVYRYKNQLFFDHSIGLALLMFEMMAETGKTWSELLDEMWAFIHEKTGQERMVSVRTAIPKNEGADKYYDLVSRLGKPGEDHFRQEFGAKFEEVLRAKGINWKINSYDITDAGGSKFQFDNHRSLMPRKSGTDGSIRLYIEVLANESAQVPALESAMKDVLNYFLSRSEVRNKFEISFDRSSGIIKDNWAYPEEIRLDLKPNKFDDETDADYAERIVRIVLKRNDGHSITDLAHLNLYYDVYRNNSENINNKLAEFNLTFGSTNHQQHPNIDPYLINPSKYRDLELDAVKTWFEEQWVSFVTPAGEKQGANNIIIGLGLVNLPVELGSNKIKIGNKETTGRAFSFSAQDYQSGKTIKIGRASQSDVPINSPTVSSFHTEIKYAQGVWLIRDANSTNGTVLRGEKYKNEDGWVPLISRSEVREEKEPQKNWYDKLTVAQLQTIGRISETALAVGFAFADIFTFDIERYLPESLAPYAGYIVTFIDAVPFLAGIFAAFVVVRSMFADKEFQDALKNILTRAKVATTVLSMRKVAIKVKDALKNNLDKARKEQEKEIAANKIKKVLFGRQMASFKNGLAAVFDYIGQNFRDANGNFMTREAVIREIEAGTIQIDILKKEGVRFFQIKKLALGKLEQTREPMIFKPAPADDTRIRVLINRLIGDKEAAENINEIILKVWKDVSRSEARSRRIASDAIALQEAKVIVRTFTRPLGIPVLLEKEGSQLKTIQVDLTYAQAEESQDIFINTTGSLEDARAFHAAVVASIRQMKGEIGDFYQLSHVIQDHYQSPNYSIVFPGSVQHPNELVIEEVENVHRQLLAKESMPGVPTVMADLRKAHAKLTQGFIPQTLEALNSARMKASGIDIKIDVADSEMQLDAAIKYLHDTLRDFPYADYRSEARSSSEEETPAHKIMRLAQDLNNDDYKTRQTAVDELTQMHKANVHSIVRVVSEVLKTGTNQGRRAAAVVLSGFGPAAVSAVPTLVEVLSTIPKTKETSIARVAMINALGVLNPQDAVVKQSAIKVLTEALSDENVSIKKEAERTLQILNRSEARSLEPKQNDMNQSAQVSSTLSRAEARIVDLEDETNALINDLKLHGSSLEKAVTKLGERINSLNPKQLATIRIIQSSKTQGSEEEILISNLLNSRSEARAVFDRSKRPLINVIFYGLSKIHRNYGHYMIANGYDGHKKMWLAPQLPEVIDNYVNPNSGEISVLIILKNHGRAMQIPRSLEEKLGNNVLIHYMPKSRMGQSTFEKKLLPILESRLAEKYSMLALPTRSEARAKNKSIDEEIRWSRVIRNSVERQLEEASKILEPGDVQIIRKAINSAYNTYPSLISESASRIREQNIFLIVYGRLQSKVNLLLEHSGNELPGFVMVGEKKVDLSNVYSYSRALHVLVQLQAALTESRSEVRGLRDKIRVAREEIATLLAPEENKAHILEVLQEAENVAGKDPKQAIKLIQRFSFKSPRSRYQAVDLAEKEGSLLRGKRSVSKKTSDSSDRVYIRKEESNGVKKAKAILANLRRELSRSEVRAISENIEQADQPNRNPLVDEIDQLLPSHFAINKILVDLKQAITARDADKIHGLTIRLAAITNGEPRLRELVRKLRATRSELRASVSPAVFDSLKSSDAVLNTSKLVPLKEAFNREIETMSQQPESKLNQVRAALEQTLKVDFVEKGTKVFETDKPVIIGLSPSLSNLEVFVYRAVQLANGQNRIVIFAWTKQQEQELKRFIPKSLLDSKKIEITTKVSLKSFWNDKLGSRLMLLGLNSDKPYVAKLKEELQAQNINIEVDDKLASLEELANMLGITEVVTRLTREFKQDWIEAVAA